ncbi:MAG TPA: NUDIX domain-containing protein [Patescibacteria group bacterium]|nr:NUDIX domain-containing protein [Patescibacteria group bacterium]
MSDFDKYTNYKTVLSVNALILSEGKILMLKRANDKKIDPGLYAGIGGKVEPHESFLAALTREIEEETGITEFESIKVYSVTQHPYPPTDSEWVNIYFIVNISKQVEVEATEDGTFHWLSFEEALKLPTAQDIHDYLEILSKNPDAFIFGFYDHDEEGKGTDKKITVI